MIEASQNDYYIWLTNKIASPVYNVDDYTSLFHKMYNTAYRYYNELDAGRYDDGFSMRLKYIRITRDKAPLEHLEGQVSLLEMFVALAERCETDIMGDSDGEPTTYKWFWAMMDGLGFVDYPDGEYDVRPVTEIINGFYMNDGEHRLFPTTPNWDVTRSIWRQLNDYLVYTYDFTLRK